MATKREHDDNKPVIHSPDALRAWLSSTITSYEAADVALRHIIETHDFKPGLLQQIFTGLSILF